MSIDYIHFSINNIYDIEDFINIHQKIDEIQKTISNNALIKFNFDNYYNNDNDNNYKNDISYKNNKIKSANFYIKTNETSELCNKYNCPICYNYIFKNKFKILLCNHVFCMECFNNWSKTCIEKSLILTCPLCREKILNIE